MKTMYLPTIALRTLLLSTLSWATIFVFPTQMAAQESKQLYSLKDLQVLAKKKSYRELYSHLRDIVPTKRDAEWEKLAIVAAQGLLLEIKDPGRRARFHTDMIKDFPSLAAVTIGDPTDLTDFEDCFTSHPRISEHCLSLVRDYSHEYKMNASVQFAIGRLIAKKMAPWLSLEFFQKALAIDSSLAICQDASAKKAVIRGLHESDKKVTTLAVKILGEYCWGEMQETAIANLRPSDEIYMANVCPTALKMRAVSGVRKKKCESL